MPQYIFDLDLTLYSEKDFTDTEDQEEYYNSFKPKPELAMLLNKLKGRKYILTNANIAHVDEVLCKLQLKNIFDDLMSSDVAESYKPSQDIYHIANHIFEIDKHKKNKDDPVYFFEDMLENLVKGKKLYNWNQVLIDPNNQNHSTDHCFKTIEDAISYFIENEKKIYSERTNLPKINYLPKIYRSTLGKEDNVEPKQKIKNTQHNSTKTNKNKKKSKTKEAKLNNKTLEKKRSIEKKKIPNKKRSKSRSKTKFKNKN